MLLILKIIKIFKSIIIHRGYVAAYAYVNKEFPEDDLIEDRNMLECFLKCFKWF